MLTIIIPAYNEQRVIANCLQSLLTQRDVTPDVEVIVSANGCSDNTVAICESYRSNFVTKGYKYRVLETKVGNKHNALNVADRIATFPARLYLDADVTCSGGLLAQVTQLLNSSDPVYFSGTLSIPAGASYFSNAYGKIWASMPYIRDTVTGIGCYGVNGAGRALWGDFPKVHSDDKFVRMLFTDDECHKTSATYQWPVPQGLLTLIKVRTRWNKGNRELRSRFPDLFVQNNSRLKTDKQSLLTMIANPIQTVVFLSVYTTAALLAGLSRNQSQVAWSRAR